MAHTYEKGYKAIFDWEQYKWLWADTLKPIDTNERPCKLCGRYATKEGHDACIPNLPNVEFACCGHGQCYKEYDHYYGYVKFTTGVELREDLFKKYFVQLI